MRIIIIWTSDHKRVHSHWSDSRHWQRDRTTSLVSVCLLPEGSVLCSLIMKLLTTVSSFAIICVASVLCRSFTPLGRPGFASSHVKRFISVDQLPLEDVIDCTSAVLEYQCSSANEYAQSIVDIGVGISVLCKGKDP